MEKKTIKPNENNDLKFRNGLGSVYNPDQKEGVPITEDTSEKKEKLEYFTE